MKANIAIVCMLLIADESIADGWADLGGRNSRGEDVGVVPAWEADSSSSRDFSLPENLELFYVYVSRPADRPNMDPTLIATYKDVRCRFKKDSRGNEIEFLCDKTGTSPLSGARYKIVPNKNPNDCNFFAKYICVEGCSAIATPKEMLKSHYECYEP